MRLNYEYWNHPTLLRAMIDISPRVPMLEMAQVKSHVSLQDSGGVILIAWFVTPYRQSSGTHGRIPSSQRSQPSESMEFVSRRTLEAAEGRLKSPDEAMARVPPTAAATVTLYNTNQDKFWHQDFNDRVIDNILENDGRIQGCIRLRCGDVKLEGKGREDKLMMFHVPCTRKKMTGASTHDFTGSDRRH
ncbi:hypothetical protein M408DRAFT_27364 [Serendipita vermifera MAFF 305830]|uniref:Uncharacterized protein n=1 Tax=Serendipita vermifera MAFF 305830 TaxID=933852 RepID=A0A0C2WCB5_SERVB|nr:hypothetical protein M408DRAFT_27364 [Serendipita vermifera MAFF 305830]